VIAYLMVVGITYGLTRYLAAARLTFMWEPCLARSWRECVDANPAAQKKMIAAINAGQKPDDALSAQAKLRSQTKHIVSTRVCASGFHHDFSNHFPAQLW